VISFYDVAKGVLEEQGFENLNDEGEYPRLARADERQRLTPTIWTNSAVAAAQSSPNGL